MKTMSESNLVKHAKQEFLRAGYKPINECKDDPDKWIQENVLELLEVFSNQGHSGFSAPYCIQYFERLARFGLIAPLKKEDCTFSEDDQCHQLSSLFKDDRGVYYLDAVVFKGNNGSCFTTEGVDMPDGTKIGSRQYVKFPFTPKTFYIDVIETEWAGKEQTEKQEGGGWWTSVVKDPSQLEEVFEYYDRYVKETDDE